ncbi:YSIRK-type signal peptide-containing protein [Gordonibacter sp. Marseille-P4307]|nr:YSIRK-type signal peptide-containing protein [Gordonibacter sp. Marseille-P4307]
MDTTSQESFKRVIALRKQLGRKVPRYARRKLSVGLVSCLIGWAC